LPRKKSPTLTEAELRLMNVLWERRSATVTDVIEALPKSLSLAYSTVLTTLRILEQKGYIKHSKEGRAFVYHPVVDRDDARRNALTHLISRFFNNSPQLLVLNLLEQEAFDAQEMEHLRRLIETTE
jgi:predicted transcriptional regulator